MFIIAQSRIGWAEKSEIGQQAHKEFLLVKTMGSTISAGG
jgi:hypothetical protein